MRILWFANTPCGASQRLQHGSQLAGWLGTLESWLAASGEVELHVCFQWDDDLPCFADGAVTYHPIRRKRMRDLFLAPVAGGRSRRETLLLCREVIARVRPDLIHIHGTEQGFALLQGESRVPVVLSLQGVVTAIAAKYFAGIPLWRFLLGESPLSHLKLASVCSHYLIFRSHALREQRMLSLARHLIGRTDWDRRTAAVLAPGARYHHGDEILRPPFYEAVWSRTAFSSPLGIVTVAGPVPYKGFETVLRVSRLLREEVGLDFTWTVVGVAPEASVARVAHAAWGEQPGVRLAGSVTAAELCRLLLEADLFCQVSHIENSSNSLCEAMMLGMPVVATCAGGTASMLQGGREGVLVQPGDPWSMAGAILELARDFDRAAGLGRAARKRALERHDPGRIVGELLQTYRQVVAERSG